MSEDDIIDCYTYIRYAVVSPRFKQHSRLELEAQFLHKQFNIRLIRTCLVCLGGSVG